jgi:hypothetical protein
VWIYEIAGKSVLRRLTFGGQNRYPVWSPDGRRVAFQSDRDGDHGLFVENADGTGVLERLTRAEEGEQPILPSGPGTDTLKLTRLHREWPRYGQKPQRAKRHENRIIRLTLALGTFSEETTWTPRATVDSHDH